VKTYVDSSLLGSLYLLEPNSALAHLEVAQAGAGLVISSLGEVELANVFQMRLFRKQLTRAEIERVQAAFESDLRHGFFKVVEVTPATFARAHKIILETTGTLDCRTADVLHVAAALEADAERLLTFDERQKELARRVKLKTN
jgi:predicted nucleic acid-binding protein